jgi:hypothetical protein
MTIIAKYFERVEEEKTKKAKYNTSLFIFILYFNGHTPQHHNKLYNNQNQTSLTHHDIQ